MKLKKIISLLLCVCLCSCLIACNNEQNDNNQAEQNIPSNEQTEQNTQSDIQTQEKDEPLKTVDLPIDTQPVEETLKPTCEPVTEVSSQFDALDSKAQGWGQGINVDDSNRPVSCDSFQNKYGKYDAIFIGPKQKNITLTFDHGYENGYTPLILDTLKEKNCK